MAPRLTAVTVAQARAREERKEIPDGGCQGLYLVIQPGGGKSWALRYRSPVEVDARGRRRTRKITLGPVAGDSKGCDGEPRVGMPLSLADARALTTRALRQVQQGVDPSGQYLVEKHTAKTINAVDTVFADFMAKYTRRRGGEPLRESTRRETGRILGLVPSNDDLSSWRPRVPLSGVLARWSGRDVASINKRDVRDLMDMIVEDGAPIGANRTLTALKTLFTWCVKRDIVTTSPCDHVDAPSPESSIERELADVEIVAIWRAAESTGYP